MKHFIFSLVIWLVTLNVYAGTPSLPKGVLKIAPRPAPALSLKNLDEETFSLDNKTGRWAFVHFWASWCGPCRREMPSIQTLVKQSSSLKLDFFIVNTAESEDVVFSFIGSVAPEVNTLLDLDGLVTEKWQPRGLPSTYLVDTDGYIRYIVLGGQNWHHPDYTRFLRQLGQNTP